MDEMPAHLRARTERQLTPDQIQRGAINALDQSATLEHLRVQAEVEAISYEEYRRIVQTITHAA